MYDYLAAKTPRSRLGVDAEDAAVADFAALAGRKQLYVPSTSVKIVSQGDEH